MRVKLTVAATVMVAALGLTGGAMVLSKAGAQPPGPSGGLAPPTGGGGAGGGSLPPGAGEPPGGGDAPPGGPPGGGGGGNRFSGGGNGPWGMGGPGGAGASVSPVMWEYKFVDVKNDRKEFEKVITQNGKEGWEFCGSERFGVVPADLVLVFKRSKGGFWFGGMGGGQMPGAGGGWRGIEIELNQPGEKGDGTVTKLFALKGHTAAEAAETLNKILAGRGIKVVANPKNNTIVISGDAATVQQLLGVIEKIIGDGDPKPGNKPKPGPAGPMGRGDPKPGEKPQGGLGMGPMSGFGPGFNPMGPGFGPKGPMGGGPMGAAAPKGSTNLNVFTLTHARAEEMVTVLKKLYPNADMTAEPRTNAVIVRADETTLEELRTLLARLDVEVTKPK